jgi:hypothetical protein
LLQRLSWHGLQVLVLVLVLVLGVAWGLEQTSY